MPRSEIFRSLQHSKPQPQTARPLDITLPVCQAYKAIPPCPKPSTVLMRQERSPAVDGLVEGRQHQSAFSESSGGNLMEVLTLVGFIKVLSGFIGSYRRLR